MSLVVCKLEFQTGDRLLVVLLSCLGVVGLALSGVVVVRDVADVALELLVGVGLVHSVHAAEHHTITHRLETLCNIRSTSTVYLTLRLRGGEKVSNSLPSSRAARGLAQGRLRASPQ